MAMLNRTAKRALIVVAIILVSGCGVMGAYVWWLSGAFQPVVWETPDGGLRIQYQPGKPMINLLVSEKFTAGSKREWVCIEPGATQRWIGAMAVPDPEEMLKRARIPLGRSDSVGLCRFYSEGNDSQRAEILAILEEDVPLSDEVLMCLAGLLGAIGEEADDENSRRIRELVSTIKDQ